MGLKEWAKRFKNLFRKPEAGQAVDKRKPVEVKIEFKSLDKKSGKKNEEIEMRILVISDSHGKNDDVKQVLEQAGDIDMFIHLGDIERGPEYIRELAKCETHMIAGNNDYDIALPDTDSFMIADKRVFITHGHRFYVGSGVERLREYALENGYDIVMYGHTHMPFLEIGKDVTILNPGSISYPRQDGRKHTFMLIEVDKEGEFHYSQGLLKSSLRDFYEGFY
mgnify:FL=1